MIHYQLQCDQGHGFDGWFPDSGSFAKQCDAGLVSCPACGGTRVRRGLMTPAVARKGNRAAKAVVPEAKAVQPVPAAAPVLPDAVRAVLQKMRAEVEEKCEHVGERFAEEARAIHHGESEARGIYGETTAAEAEALAEEGIEVGRIPWVPLADS